MILLGIGIIILFNYASTIANFFWVIGAYILVCILLNLVKAEIKSKVLYVIVRTFLFPFSIIVKFIILAFPVMATQIYLLLYLAISFAVPIIFFIIDQNLDLTWLRIETWIYLIATTGAITATLFHKQITFLTFKIIPFTARETWKTRRSKIVELCEYIVSKNNVKLVIYAIFFITLIIFTILGLQERSYYKNSNIDNAILQSFATFIAFERILNNLELTKFKASELLETLRLSIFRNDKKSK